MADPTKKLDPLYTPGQLDTGSPGFEIDGKLYTFDVGLPGNPNPLGYGPYVKTIDVDSDLLDASGKPKDISTPTRVTLGNYLSDVTMAKPGKGSAKVANRYPITRPSETAAPRKLDDQRGDPTGPTPVSEANGNSFGGTVNPYSAEFPIVSPELRKGKGGAALPTAKDGNDFLTGDVNGDQTPVGKYRSAVLGHNRFTAAEGKKYTEGSDHAFDLTLPAGQIGFNPKLSNQQTMGKFDPNAPAFSTGRMSLIGPLLTLRAGKEIGSAAGNVSPNDAGIQAGALLPGVSQIGISRVDLIDLMAEDVLNDLTHDEPHGVRIISPGGLSWGQLNNVDDPYSGTDALGMVVLSTALVAGVSLVFDGLSVLLGLITPSLKTAARDSRGRYSLGEYIAGSKKAKKSAGGGIGGALSALSSLNFGALLGIQPTNYPFKVCLTKGMNAFFQLPDDKGVLGQLGGAATSAIDSPGFNVVVARTIIRSSITIVDSMKKIGGNVMNAITAILALIDNIRSSKLIAACNIFANLGDQLLSLPERWIDAGAAGGVKLSQVDAIEDDLSNAVIKSRLRGSKDEGSLKLAWASNRAPANLLIPKSILSINASVKGLGQFDPGLGAHHDQLSKMKTIGLDADQLGRISPEDAAKFEEQLDSEYVPFYFHDIRTNEMIAFHAFLASLSDDYTAAYDKVDGIGRVEPVKIYKSTERRIAMSFFIAATSLNDFDEMWVKINKLITLVYPQYTQGVQLTSADGSSYKFTQPFSQLVGASPLVRIRLGDLLRSNYTQFALGRLFGLGNPNFTLNNAKPGDPKFDIEKFTAALVKTKENPNGETYDVMPGSYEFIDSSDAPGGLSLPVPPLPVGGSSQGPKFAPNFSPQFASIPGLFTVKAKKVGPDGNHRLICEVQYNEDPQYQKIHEKAIAKADNIYANDKNIAQKVKGGTYLIPEGALIPTAKTRRKILSDIGSEADEFATELSTFLSPEKNAIAKSFKDTGGKGLAGFIESMNFDWYDKVTWETHSGRTAPKLCKVTLTFSPIHDISPGLDHLGFNRAPIYPVGTMGQSEG